MTVYRQIAWKLRFHRADRSQRESVRPRIGERGPYTDLPPNPPTLIEFEPGDEVDVNDLLKIGAIVPWQPPEPEAPGGGETS